MMVMHRYIAAPISTEKTGHMTGHMTGRLQWTQCPEVKIDTTGCRVCMCEGAMRKRSEGGLTTGLFIQYTTTLERFISTCRDGPVSGHCPSGPLLALTELFVNGVNINMKPEKPLNNSTGSTG